MYRLWGDAPEAEEARGSPPRLSPPEEPSTLRVLADISHRPPPVPAGRWEAQRQHSVALLRQKAYDAHRNTLEEQLRLAKRDASQMALSCEELQRKLDEQVSSAEERAKRLEEELLEERRAGEAHEQTREEAVRAAVEQRDATLAAKTVRPSWRLRIKLPQCH